MTNDELREMAVFAMVKAWKADAEASRQWQQVVEWQNRLVARLPDGPEREQARLDLADAEERVRQLGEPVKLAWAGGAEGDP